MDIPEYSPYQSPTEKQELISTLESGIISPAGDKVRRFEKEVRNYLGAENGVAVDSGTAALHLALECLNLSPDADVIVPCLTYGSTALSVEQAGLNPVLVDVDRKTLGIDPKSLREEITPNTEAVIVVHLLGKTADMDPLIEIAEENDLYIVEDAAQSLGSSYKSKNVGTIGDIGCFSFSWNKNITTGKGGFLVTDNKSLGETAKQLSDYGRCRETSEFELIGYNYRMDNLRASIGLEQLKSLEKIIHRKKSICRIYRNELDSHGLRMNNADSPYMFYLLSKNRDKLYEHLKAEGITPRLFHPPLNEMAAFKDKGSFPQTHELYRKGLILPTYPDLSNREAEIIGRKVSDLLNNI